MLKLILVGVGGNHPPTNEPVSSRALWHLLLELLRFRRLVGSHPPSNEPVSSRALGLLLLELLCL